MPKQNRVMVYSEENLQSIIYQCVDYAFKLNLERYGVLEAPPTKSTRTKKESANSKPQEHAGD